MELSNDDVSEILQLLDAGPFHELHLQTLRFRLLLRRDSEVDGEWTQSTQILSTPNLLLSSATQAPAAGAAVQPGNERIDVDHLLAVRSPLPGTFYRAPRPGSAPFVEVGSHVEKDTLVGIVETMKLMNSVHAGSAGKVMEICYGNGEVVPKDGVLMYLEPGPAA